MSFLQQVRDPSGNLVKNCFKKVATAGDIFRIDVREPGKYEVFAALAPGTVSLTLSFNYQVGNNQLCVAELDASHLGMLIFNS